LRRQLDAASLQHVKIVGSDAQWDPISSDVLKDAELRAAVAVLSSHCECRPRKVRVARRTA